MSKWRDFLDSQITIDGIHKAGKAAAASDKTVSALFDRYGIYAHSVEMCVDTVFFIAKEAVLGSGKKHLVLAESPETVKTGRIPNPFSDFEGYTERISGFTVRCCELTHHNAAALRKHFPYSAPVCLRSRDITIGLGDRLGIATPGHIRLVKNYDMAPVFAQQSIRELTLTGRTYENVLDDVTFAVFQEGYKTGFGADGDHLKTAEEVKMALDLGYTMLTLDCSEHINNDIAGLNSGAVDTLYTALDPTVTARYEHKYLGSRTVGGQTFDITLASLKKIVLIYNPAIDFAEKIYKTFFEDGGNVVFELSIDETMTPTAPEAHYLVAAELFDRGVQIDNLAPRFCGEFQKGIDYIGDVGQFASEFKTHCAIAEHFGYKVSVHSGSDKFSVFQTVGDSSKGHYHLKTAGTNWLEAVRTVAKVNPGLYRRMHDYAVKHIDEARKYYHISAEAGNIPDIGHMKDTELPTLMDQTDARQFLHITYGLILTEGYRETFYNEFYNTLAEYEAEYADALIAHLGKHLHTLNVPKR